MFQLLQVEVSPDFIKPTPQKIFDKTLIEQIHFVDKLKEENKSIRSNSELLGCFSRNS